MKNTNEPVSQENFIDKLSDNGWLKQAIRNNTGRNQIILKFLFKCFNNWKGLNTPLLNSLLDNMSGFFSIKTVFWVCAHPLEFVQNVRDLYQISQIIVSEPNHFVMVEKLLNNEKMFKIFQGDTPDKSFFGEVAYEFYNKIFLKQANKIGKTNTDNIDEDEKIEKMENVSKEDFIKVLNNLYIFAHKNAKLSENKKKFSDLDLEEIFYAFVDEFYGNDPSDEELESQKKIITKILRPILVFKIKSDIWSKSENKPAKDTNLVKKVASWFQAMDSLDVTNILSSKNQWMLIENAIDLVNIVAVKLKNKRPKIVSFEGEEKIVETMSLKDMNKQDLIHIVINDAEFATKLASLADSFTSDQLDSFLLFIVKTYILSDKKDTLEDQVFLANLIKTTVVSMKEADIKSEEVAQKKGEIKPDEAPDALSKKSENPETVYVEKLYRELQNLRKGTEEALDAEMQQYSEKEMVKPFYLRILFPSNRSEADFSKNIFSMIINNPNLAKKLIEKFKIPLLSEDNYFQAVRGLMIILNKLDKTGKDFFIKKVFLAIEQIRMDSVLLENLKNVNFYEIFEKIKFKDIICDFDELEVNEAIKKVITVFAENFHGNELVNPSYLDFYNALIGVYAKLDKNEKEIVVQLAKDFKLFRLPRHIKFAAEEVINPKEKLEKIATFLDKFVLSDFAKLIMFKKLSRGVLKEDEKAEASALILKNFIGNIRPDQYKTDEFGKRSLSCAAAYQMAKITQMELDPEEKLEDFLRRHLFSTNEDNFIQDLINDETKEIIIDHKPEFKYFLQRWLYRIDPEKLSEQQIAFHEEWADLGYDLSIIALEELINYRENLRDYQGSGLNGEAILALNISCNEKLIGKLTINGSRNIELFKKIVPDILVKFGPKLSQYDSASQNLGDIMSSIVKIFNKNKEIYDRKNGKLNYKKLILELEKLEALNGEDAELEKLKFRNNVKALALNVIPQYIKQAPLDYENNAEDIVENLLPNPLPRDLTKVTSEEDKILFPKKVLRTLLPVLTTIVEGIEYTDKCVINDDKKSRNYLTQTGWTWLGKLLTPRYRQDSPESKLEKLAAIEPLLYFYTQGIHVNSLLKSRERNEDEYTKPSSIDKNGKTNKFGKYFEPFISEESNDNENVVAHEDRNLSTEGWAGYVGSWVNPYIDKTVKGFGWGVSRLSYYATGGKFEIDAQKVRYKTVEDFVLGWKEYIEDFSANILKDVIDALSLVTTLKKIRINEKTIKHWVVSLIEDEEFLSLVKDNIKSVIRIIEKTDLLDSDNLENLKNTIGSLISVIEKKEPLKLEEIKELIDKLVDISLMVSSKLLSLELEKPSEEVQLYYRDLKIVKDVSEINLERMDLFQKLRSYRNPEPKAYLFSKKQYSINSLNMTEFEFSEGEIVKYMDNTDFAGINMNKSVFRKLVIQGCNFKSCDMKNMQIRNCEFKGHNLNRKIIQNFENVDLSGAKIENSSISCCSFKKVTFKNVIFEGEVTFDNCSFEDVVFENCDLSKVSFISCDAKKTVFDNANLSGRQEKDFKKTGVDIEIKEKKSSEANIRSRNIDTSRSL